MKTRDKARLIGGPYEGLRKLVEWSQSRLRIVAKDGAKHIYVRHRSTNLFEFKRTIW